MKKDVSKIIKGTLVYLIGNVLSKAIVFLLIPLYTSYIAPDKFGFYDAAVAVVQFVQGVLFLDIGATILRFMYDNIHDKRKAVVNGKIIFSISMVIYILVSVFIVLFAKIEYSYLLLIYGAFSIWNVLESSIARGNGFGTFYAFSGVIGTLINVGCNLLFLIVFKFDYKALYISSILSLGIQVLLLFIKNKNLNTFKKIKSKIKNKKLKNNGEVNVKKFDLKYKVSIKIRDVAGCFNKNLLKKMYKYALPLSINAAAYWGLTSVNKIIITAMLGKSATGFLGIANKFTGIMYLLSTCFQLAWQELAFSKGNNSIEENGRFYSQASELFTKVLFAGILVLLPMINLMTPILINETYNESIILIPLALIGTIFSIYSSFLGNIFGGLKKTNTIFLTTFIGAIFNIGLLFLLLHLGVGVMGSNIAFLCGFALTCLLRIVFLKKYIPYKIKWKWLVLALPYLVLACFVFNLEWYWNLGLMFGMMIVSFAILKNELFEILSSLFKKKKNKKSIDNTDGEVEND